MHRLLAISVALAACGDNQRPCSYVEHDDADNDTVAEATHVAIGGAVEDVCGAIDGGHATGGTLDVDRFRVSLAGSDMLFQLAADDGAAILPAGLELRVFDTAAVPTLLVDLALDVTKVDHAAQLVELPTGDYDLVVSADAPGDLTGSIDYRLRVSPFDFAGCTVSGKATYTEADDAGNAVVAIDYAKTPQFSSMSGTPETTRISADAGHDAKLSGSAGTDAGGAGDDYLDRDTFALATDDTTNEMTVRLAWTDPVDLDYALFEDGALTPTAISNTASATVQELQTFAVKPSTRYWLWVGRHAGTSDTTVTAAYDATVCATHFFH